MDLHEKKIEFINRVQKLQVYSKEAAYFAFPFAGAQARFRYALQNGWNPAAGQPDFHFELTAELLSRLNGADDQPGQNR